MSTSTFDENWFSIEKLDATNWLTWKFRIIAILEERELLDHINGNTQRPEAANDEERTSEAFQEKESKWLKADRSARNQIILTVGNEDIVHIARTKTAKEAWDALVLVHEPLSGPLSNLAAFRTLFRTVANEETDIEEHLAELGRARAHLMVMQGEIPDSFYAGTILASLPPSWDSFIIAHFGDKADAITKLSSLEIERVVRDEWRRRHHPTGNNSVGNRSNAVCKNCGRRGHRKKHCWREGGGAFGKGPKQ